MRLGYILASLLWAGAASALPQDVPGAGLDPELDACWASGPATPEHLGPCLGMSPAEIGGTPRTVKSALKLGIKPVSSDEVIDVVRLNCDGSETTWAERVPGGFLPVCGDARCNVVRVLNPATVRCESKASLDYRLAELVGVDPDAAWEDSYAACVAE